MSISATLWVRFTGPQHCRCYGCFFRFFSDGERLLATSDTERHYGLYSDVRVTLVRDADVTRQRLDAIFADLASKVRNDDLFIFCVAGHGMTVDGRYYFVPHDFKFGGDRLNVEAARAAAGQGIAQGQRQV